MLSLRVFHFGQKMLQIDQSKCRLSANKLTIQCNIFAGEGGEHEKASKTRCKEREFLGKI